MLQGTSEGVAVELVEEVYEADEPACVIAWLVRFGPIRSGLF